MLARAWNEADLKLAKARFELAMTTRNTPEAIRLFNVYGWRVVRSRYMPFIMHVMPQTFHHISHHRPPHSHKNGWGKQHSTRLDMSDPGLKRGRPDDEDQSDSSTKRYKQWVEEQRLLKRSRPDDEDINDRSSKKVRETPIQLIERLRQKRSREPSDDVDEQSTKRSRSSLHEKIDVDDTMADEPDHDRKWVEWLAFATELDRKKAHFILEMVGQATNVSEYTNTMSNWQVNEVKSILFYTASDRLVIADRVYYPVKHASYNRFIVEDAFDPSIDRHCIALLVQRTGAEDWTVLTYSDVDLLRIVPSGPFNNPVKTKEGVTFETRQADNALVLSAVTFY
jgi:hypothetical protein